MRNMIPDHLNIPTNGAVLEYIDGRSSHGDLTEVFLQSLEGLSEARSYCPDHQAFAYCIAYRGSKVFGFCRSMRSVSFLLPESLYESARKSGGAPTQDLTVSGWFDFPAFDARIKPDHVVWAEAAYLNVMK